LLAGNGGATCGLDGERYRYLERDETKPDALATILKAYAQ
jgi:hypothetical protein